MALLIDQKYTPDELRREYAVKARSMFNQNQRSRTHYSRLSVAFTLAITLVGLLTAFDFSWCPAKWCAVALVLLCIAFPMSRSSQKTVEHALAAMTCLRYAQKFEAPGGTDDLPRTIDAFEQETRLY